MGNFCVFLFHFGCLLLRQSSFPAPQSHITHKPFSSQLHSPPPTHFPDSLCPPSIPNQFTDVSLVPTSLIFCSCSAPPPFLFLHYFTPFLSLHQPTPSICPHSPPLLVPPTNYPTPIFPSWAPNSSSILHRLLFSIWVPPILPNFPPPSPCVSF